MRKLDGMKVVGLVLLWLLTAGAGFVVALQVNSPLGVISMSWLLVLANRWVVEVSVDGFSYKERR